MQLQLHSGVTLSHPVMLCIVENSAQLENASRCASSQGTAPIASLSRGGLHPVNHLACREQMDSIDPNAQCSTMQGLHSKECMAQARLPIAASNASQPQPR